MAKAGTDKENFFSINFIDKSYILLYTVNQERSKQCITVYNSFEIIKCHENSLQ